MINKCVKYSFLNFYSYLTRPIVKSISFIHKRLIGVANHSSSKTDKLSFNAKCIADYHAIDALVEKVSNISLLLKTGEKLDVRERFTTHELYLTYKAQQLLHSYQQGQENDKLNPFYQKYHSFLKDSDNVVRACFENLKIKPGALISLSLSRYFTASGRSESFMKLRKALLHGDTMHTSLVHPLSTKESLKQAHISFQGYVVEDIRFIELLASDFLVLDFSQLIGKKVDQTQMQSKFAKHVNAVIQEQPHMQKVKNTEMRKFLSTFRITRLFSEKTLYGMKSNETMLCSEMVAYIYREALKRLGNELSTSIFNPFEGIKISGLLPSDLDTLVRRYSKF